MLAARLTIQAPALPREQGREQHDTLSFNGQYIRGHRRRWRGPGYGRIGAYSAHYANRPDAIATLVERLRTGPEVTRIVLEPTGGYEKALVKALRQARLPVEIIHTTRFNAYRASGRCQSQVRHLGCQAACFLCLQLPTRSAAARPATSN